MAEVIELNNHKLLNGDATNKEDVDKLIGDCTVNLLLTDPPYGINIVNTNGGGANRWTRRYSNQTIQTAESVEQNLQHSRGTVGTPARPGFKTSIGGAKSIW